MLFWQARTLETLKCPRLAGTITNWRGHGQGFHSLDEHLMPRQRRWGNKGPYTSARRLVAHTPEPDSLLRTPAFTHYHAAGLHLLSPNQMERMHRAGLGEGLRPPYPQPTTSQHQHGLGSFHRQLNIPLQLVISSV